VQRRGAAAVDSVDVRTCGEQRGDRRDLRRAVPVRGAWPAVDGVVQRRGTAPVARVDVGAGRDQRAHDRGAIGSRGDVQRGVAGVDVVRDGDEEVSHRALA
jgi:hypothetical protein